MTRHAAKCALVAYTQMAFQVDPDHYGHQEALTGLLLDLQHLCASGELSQDSTGYAGPVTANFEDALAVAVDRFDFEHAHASYADKESSASRQHYIDTGIYLPKVSDEPIPYEVVGP